MRAAQHTNNGGINMGWAIAFAMFALAALICAYMAQQTGAPAVTETTVKMLSDVDRIKQTIREKEVLRDAYADQAAALASKGNNAAADAAAQAAGALITEIEKLYNDLHEANMKEGDKDESDK